MIRGCAAAPPDTLFHGTAPRQPVILRVAAAGAHAAGTAFYLGSEIVLLSDQIPASFIVVESPGAE